MMLAPLCMYCRQRARHVEVAEHVGAEGPLELLGIESSRRIVDLVLLGGVVDQDVDAAELLECALDRLPAEHLVADVALEQDRAAALVLDQARGLLGVVVLFEIEDRDQRALARHRDRDRAADAAVAAGDDRDLVLQLADAGIFRQDTPAAGASCFRRPAGGPAPAAAACFLRLFGGLFGLVMDVHVRASGCRDGNVSARAGFQTSHPRLRSTSTIVARRRQRNRSSGSSARGASAELLQPAVRDPLRSRAALLRASATSVGSSGPGLTPGNTDLRANRRCACLLANPSSRDARRRRAGRERCAQRIRDARSGARRTWPARARARGSETARRTIRRASSTRAISLTAVEVGDVLEHHVGSVTASKRASANEQHVRPARSA